MNNIQKLLSMLNKENIFDDSCSIVIISKINRLYLSGFTSSSGLIFITPGASYYLVDSRYAEDAKTKVKNCQVIVYEKLDSTLLMLAKKHNTKITLFENHGVYLDQFIKISSYFYSAGIRVNNESILDKKIFELRSVKSPDELNKIKTAQQITDAAFNYILSKLHLGITEKQIAWELESFMRKNGADSISFDIIVLFGKRTSLPHGVPSENTLKKGDFVLIDMGAVVEHYCSDMTRTVAFGHLSQYQHDIYNVVLNANLNAINEIKADIKCSEIDKIARTTIKKSGFADYFGHATGHSVGLEIHEQPNFSNLDHTLLKEHMVITVEPGIYLPGRFGVRIEDLIIVNKHDCTNITETPKELILI